MRKVVLTGVVLAMVAVMTGPAHAFSGRASAFPGNGSAGRFDRPHTGFADPETVLQDGSPEEVGLATGPIDDAQRRVAGWTERTPGLQHPMYAGEVSLLAHDGVVVSRQAAGDKLRYADGKGTELPPQQQEKVSGDTIFDIASLTKLFTSIAALQLIERGKVRLDAPVAGYVPEFASNGKEAVTVEQLLTHTSGLQATIELDKLPPQQRIPAVLDAKPQNPPGSVYRYSDLNMITLGVLVARVSGKPLDQVIHDRITAPLGMTDTGFNPPQEKLHRIAATEYQTDPPRGMVRGEVEDENAWSLGGVAGQAGIFSTADDLAALGQAILNGGIYRGQRILDQRTVQAMLTNYNGAFPGDAHGLGVELDQRWYMAGLSGPRTAGHTGFTGTSLVIDPMSRSIAVLLTNRVHPSRDWGSNNLSRRVLAQGLAEALAVRPVDGPQAWYVAAGHGKPAAALTTDQVGPATGDVKVSFDAFVDTQNDPDGMDTLTLESSVDGGSTWRTVPVRAQGPGAPGGNQDSLAGAGHRAWWHVEGTVPVPQGASVQLRWRYSENSEYHGRGVYVDGIVARDRDHVLLDGERQNDRFTPQGWTPASR